MPNKVVLFCNNCNDDFSFSSLGCNSTERRFSFININVGVLYLFAVSSLGVYGIIMGGWKNQIQKYPFLGAIRSAAQMVSYEISIGIIIINVLLCVGS